MKRKIVLIMTFLLANQLFGQTDNENEMLNKSIRELASKEVSEIMENALTFRVPLRINLSVGSNWEEAH